MEAWRSVTSTERLAREARLTRASAFREVLRSGRRRRLRHVDVIWSVNRAGHPRLGMIVPKFQSTAVARNRLRRQIREIWRRRMRPVLPGVDMIVRVRPEAYEARFQDLAAELGSWSPSRRGKSE